MTTVDQSDSQTFEAVIVLHLAGGKLPDGDLSDVEAQRIVELTTRHTAGLSPEYGAQVVRDVATALASTSDPAQTLARVVAAAEHLRDHLSPQAKQQLVDELRSIASADGHVSGAEQQFIDAAAKTLGVDPNG
ncbi:MAG: TerB family tellurite resistance protein [Deltaproteobacteria bacterium]|nr:TerB family tellurite resistance protein [Deltaproteobacteria bacterium]